MHFLWNLLLIILWWFKFQIIVKIINIIVILICRHTGKVIENIVNFCRERIQ